MPNRQNWLNHLSKGNKTMKALLLIILVISVCLTGCASSMVVNGKTVSPYGLFNKSKKQENVLYKTSGWSFLWGTLGIPVGLLGPIYFYGFNLYEPVGEKDVTQKADRQK
jgi:hypothetical protein